MTVQSCRDAGSFTGRAAGLQLPGVSQGFLPPVNELPGGSRLKLSPSQGMETRPDSTETLPRAFIYARFANTESHDYDVAKQ